jgi:hypothetical protein
MLFVYCVWQEVQTTSRMVMGLARVLHDLEVPGHTYLSNSHVR